MRRGASSDNTNVESAASTSAEAETSPAVRLVYYASVEHEPLRHECNAGIEGVPQLLDRVRSLGVPVECVDTSRWTSEQLGKAYTLAATPAVVRHSKAYSVRRAFGTRRRGGDFFARGVPALLVYSGEGGLPVDVFPHYQEDRPVTIRDFLVQLLEDPGRALGSGRRFTSEAVAGLRRLRRELFRARHVPGDSTRLIREIRQGR